MKPEKPAHDYVRWTPTERQSLRVAWHDPSWSWDDISESLRRSVRGVKEEAVRCRLPPCRRPGVLIRGQSKWIGADGKTKQIGRADHVADAGNKVVR